MLTLPDIRATRGWLRFGGAILMLSLVVGCAGSSASSLPSPRGSSAVASGPATSPPSGPDPASILAKALVPLQAASAFETVVEVGGTTIVNAKGRSVGDSNRLTVTTGGKAVEYIEIPPKAWAREPKGKWVLVAADQAPGSPLDALANPLGVTEGASGASGSLLATYPAAALGLEGEPLTVQITIDGTTVTFRYTASTEGHDTSSTTTIRPAKPDPITAPAS